MPVRNEATALAATPESIAAQRTLHGAPFDLSRIEVLLLANNCSDDCAPIAGAFARANPALAVHVAEVQLTDACAHIGHVRRLLMDAACARLEYHGRGGLVVSTGGDTVVDPRWLASMLQEFDEDLFERFVKRIIVHSRSDIRFELKCGLTLRERK